MLVPIGQNPTSLPLKFTAPSLFIQPPLARGQRRFGEAPLAWNPQGTAHEGSEPLHYFLAVSQLAATGPRNEVENAVLVHIWRQLAESRRPLPLAQARRVGQVEQKLHSGLRAVGVLATRPTAAREAKA